MVVVVGVALGRGCQSNQNLVAVMAVWHSVEGVRWAVVVVASLLAGDLDTYFKLIPCFIIVLG